MYNNAYYNPQMNIERINNQISELERMRSQLQQPVQPITQNFQITPTNRETIKYANSIDEVQRDTTIGEIPYFSKDMSVVWVKNTKGEIKTYELKEIIPKDEKDIKIELLQAQIEELKKGIKNNARTNNANVDEPIEDEEPTNVSNGRTSTKKSKQSNGDD